jgi:hypothetical protein
MEKWLAAALDYIPQWIDFQMRLTEQPGVSIAVSDRASRSWSRPSAMPTPSRASP